MIQKFVERFDAGVAAEKHEAEVDRLRAENEALRERNVALEAKCTLLGASLTKADAETEALRAEVEKWKEAAASHLRLLDHDANQKALRAFAAENAALRARIEALETYNACDACVGGACPPVGKCMCGGSGKMSDAAHYLRERFVATEKEREALRSQLPSDAERVMREAAKLYAEAKAAQIKAQGHSGPPAAAGLWTKEIQFVASARDALCLAALAAYGKERG